MGLGAILLIVLILMLIGVISTWPHGRNWSYGPSGGWALGGDHPDRPGADGSAVTGGSRPEAVVIR